MAKEVITGELTCPICKRKMWESENSFQCRGKKEGACSFYIAKKILGKKIPDKAIVDLVTKKQTGLIKGFVSTKTGNKFDASLYIDKQEMMVKLRLPEKKVPDDPAFKCIKCGKSLKPVSWGYACTGYPVCKWSIGEVFGVRLDDDQIKALLQGESVYVRGMKPKDPSKSAFSAQMKLDPGTGYVTFAEEKAESKSPATAENEDEEDEEYTFEAYEDDDE